MNQADQGDGILPPQTAAPSRAGLDQAWSPAHLKLHRHLLRQPGLLPNGATLLVAVSGGQDSMALLGLLLGLQRLHSWRLLLWHGNHLWRSEATQQAAALQAWCERLDLHLSVDRWCAAAEGSVQRNEAAARHWRYACLKQRALAQHCNLVVTGHTASDRAETLLLHLARGSHLRGLASLRSQRDLSGTGLQLSRPMLAFDRDATAQICSDLGLPVWRDRSNDEPCFSRNRIRQEVIPVLEALHPGATGRLSGTAARLQETLECQHEWLQIALQWLSDHDGGLLRQRLTTLQRANQATVLELWLRQRGVPQLGSEQIATLLSRLQAGQPPGRCDLAGGWLLHWNRTKLELTAT